MALLQPPSCPMGGRLGHWRNKECPNGLCPPPATDTKPPTKEAPPKQATPPKSKRLAVARKVLETKDAPEEPKDPPNEAKKPLTGAEKAKRYRTKHRDAVLKRDRERKRRAKRIPAPPSIPPHDEKEVRHG